MNLISLTTDFGLRDAYVAAMKGVMLGINPACRFVDISHEVAPQDIMEAAFVLKNAAPFFPAGTVHLVVVDPGVGTSRLPVALRYGDHLFVGPDNGIFSLLVEDSPPEEIVVLDRTLYHRTPAPSATFHGRDVFAPVAAHLSRGLTLQEIGSPVSALTPLRWALPIEDDRGIRGWVIHIDRFGNGITNVTREALERHGDGRKVKGYIGGGIINGIHTTFADVPQGDPLLLFGSTGFLEVAVNGGNAAELLGIRKGAAVNLFFLDRHA